MNDITPCCGSCAYCEMSRSLFRYCRLKRDMVYAPCLLVCKKYRLFEPEDTNVQFNS